MSVLVVQPPVTVRHPPSGSGAAVLFRDTIVVRDAAAALLLLPDVERLVIDFLLDQDELYDLVAGRVYSELPATKTFPAVRVHQFFDDQVSGPALWLMRYLLQVDVWGGSKKTSRLIADSIRYVLVHRLVGVHDEGVVTASAVRGLDTTADDSVPTTESKARPRCRFTAEVYAHPALVGS